MHVQNLQLPHFVVVAEVVSVLDALVAPHDVEEVVLLQEGGGDVRTEHAGEAAVVGEATLLLLLAVKRVVLVFPEDPLRIPLEL